MSDSSQLSPDETLDTTDPGDETAHRYRYQWTYAAIMCCVLLDDTEDVIEVFCEHHEDVLLKHADGTFSGIQVKTKKSNQPIWKTNDDAVKNSFIRFIKLEGRFPGRFRKYLFLTNHPIFSGKNGQDINYVLEQIKKSANVDDLPKGIRSFLKGLAKQSEATESVALIALSKVDARDDLPKLQDIDARLIAALTETWSRAKDSSYAAVLHAARHVIAECSMASSLGHKGLLPSYLSGTTDPEKKEQIARIAGKRVDRPKFLQMLEKSFVGTELLSGEPGSVCELNEGATDLLLKKLDAGGFSAVSCNSAEDLRSKADYLGIMWTKKYGDAPGFARYDHVRSLVLSDAARAFEATKEKKDPFGLNMLTELRARFKERRTQGGILHECTDEHLEGVAYSLTSQCKVRWSNATPWEKE